MITVFTPTYNRKHTLPRLYDSLKKQTDYDFEWIIVDDASTDGTEQYIQSLIGENKDFDITYIKQEHGGKHRAINKALDYTKAEWFFIVDSDDFLMDNAIELVKNWICLYGDEEELAAFSGSKFDINRKIAMSVPSILKDNPGLKCLNHERAFFDLSLDKAEIYKTSILRQYRFPEYKNEFFVTEAECWNRISYDGFYTRFFPDSIYCCEYLIDGLTTGGANTKRGFSKNYYGFLDYLKILLKVQGIDWETVNLTVFAYEEAKKHNIDYTQLANILDIKEDTLKSIYSKRFMIIFLKILMKICEVVKEKIFGSKGILCN